jgi:hypothetical protein
VIRNPGFPNPFSGGAALVLPPSRAQVAEDLRQPYIFQSSLMLERELPKNLRLLAMFFNVRAVGQLRGRNINAPLGLGQPRSDPALGNVTRIESTANADTRFFNLNLNWLNLPRRIFFGAAYSWSQSDNEADGPLSLPADNFNLRGERGPSAQDIRHRFFLNANVGLPYRFRLGLLANANSAAPYNVTTGFDNNGDTNLNDRPAGVRRNSARGAGRFDLSTRLSWGFGFGTVKENGPGGPQVRVVRGDSDAGDILGMGGMPGGKPTRYHMEFFLQATNLLNRSNLTNFVGVQTSPFFGRATAALPGRRIETGLRFTF